MGKILSAMRDIFESTNIKQIITFRKYHIINQNLNIKLTAVLKFSHFSDFIEYRIFSESSA